MLRFRYSQNLIFQGLRDVISGFVIPYIYIVENGLLLRNISKCIVNLRGFAYNKGVATFWQQKISKPE